MKTVFSTIALLLICHAASAQPSTISTLAGSREGTPGYQEGSRGSVRFRWPASLAVDGEGNVFVADSRNHAIRKLTPLGGSTLFAGWPGQPGASDGAGTNAGFNSPQGIAIGPAGYLYVADTGNHVIRKISPAGTVTTLAGMAGDPGNADGPGGNAQFFHPQAIAVDETSTVFVADTWNHLIRRVSSDSTVTTIAGRVHQQGSADGSNHLARFHWPSGIAVANGNIFVADYGNHLVRRLTTDGTNWFTSTIAGYPAVAGVNDGTNRSSRFFEPQGVASAPDGTLYVVDSGNQTIRKILPSGTNWIVSTVAGVVQENGNTDGPHNAAQFHWPSSVALDAAGYLYIADSGNNAIRVDRIVPPQLQVNASGNGIVLSWSVLDSGFTLETSPAIPSGTWTAVTNGVVTSGDDYVFTNAPAGSGLFYRLKRP